MASEDSSSSAAPPARTRLTGWKEIAAFFDKGVRTVQRWEKDVGLPVHRISTGGGEVVYAFVAELEAWQASAAGRNAARDAADAANRSVAVAPAEAPRPGDNEQTAARPWSGWKARAWIVGGAVVILAVAGFAYRWLAGEPTVGPPAQWRVEGNKLVISDRAGRFLWDYAFEFPLDLGVYATPWALHEDHPAAVFHDIDGDGRTEVLFVHEPWRASSRGLFCFRHDGALLFHHEPDYVVRFGEKTYARPWRAAAVYVTGPADRPHDVWFVSSHLEEFPTVLEKLDIAGNVKSAYWSNGQIYSFVTAEVGGRSLVFVGAVSNEFKGGSLAILDATQPSGSAPAASDHYRCTGCPPGEPVAFFVFPRLDATAAIDGHSRITNAFVDRLGQVMVDVRHDVGGQLPPELRDAATTHYTLDSQFRVVAAELGMRVARIHAEFERKGLLNHAFDPGHGARSLWPVLRWDGSRFQEIAGLETGGQR